MGSNLYRDFRSSQLIAAMGVFFFLTSARRGCEADRDRERTATLRTALLHRARGALAVRTQMRTPQRGSIPIAWTSLAEATKGPERARQMPSQPSKEITS